MQSMHFPLGVLTISCRDGCLQLRIVIYKSKYVFELLKWFIILIRINITTGYNKHIPGSNEILKNYNIYNHEHHNFIQ